MVELKAISTHSLPPARDRTQLRFPLENLHGIGLICLIALGASTLTLGCECIARRLEAKKPEGPLTFFLE